MVYTRICVQDFLISCMSQHVYFRFLVNLLFVFSLSAHAQDDVFELSLHELMEIKISGVTQVETPLLWSPASINVFDQRLLKLANIDNLSQLTPLIPSFQSSRHDDGLFNSISTRGRRIGTSGRELLVLMDGMRIDNWFAGGANFSMPNISLFGSEKIEFIRGAISQLYGSGAYTGVINIETDPSLRNAKLSVDEYGSSRFQANIGNQSVGFQQKLFLDIYQQSLPKETITKPQTSHLTQLDATQETLSGHYQAHWGDWSFYSIMSQSYLKNYYVTGTYSLDNTKDQRTFYNGSVKHERHWSNSLSTSIQGGYRFFEYLPDIEAAPSGALAANSNPSSSDPFFLNVDKNYDDEYWLNLKSTIKISEQTNLQAGMEWRDIHKSESITLGNFDLAALASNNFPISSSNDISIKTTTMDAQSEQLLALYLQSISRVTPNNEITLGIRYDSYDTVGSNTAPRLTWVHLFDPNTSIKFIYSEAFRAPVSNELYQKNNPFVIGNESLKPELVKTSEIVGYYQNGLSQLQLGIFYSHFENPIAQKSIGSLRVFDNLEDNFSKGIEGNATMQFEQHWISRFNFSHLFHKPSDQYRMPDTLATLSLAYQNHPFNWSYIVQYTSERESNPSNSVSPNSLDSYWLQDTSIQYQLNERSRLSLNISNLFDEQYSEPSTADNLNHVPGMRRTLTLNYQAEF